MKHLRRNRKIFNVSEVALFLVSLGVIVVFAWYLFGNNGHSRRLSNNISNTIQQKRYVDSYLSFEYPANWTAEKQFSFDNDIGFSSVVLKSSIDPTLPPSHPHTLKDIRLRATISIVDSRQDPNRSCQKPCVVYSAQNISPAFPFGKNSLVVSDWAGQGLPQIITLSQDEAAAGQKTYTIGADLADTPYYLRFDATYVSGNIASLSFKPWQAMIESSAYHELTSIIKSTKVDITALPK